MNRRKGKLIDLKDTGKDKKRLIFHAPTRGLMGYTSRFLTLTKGNGVINRIFHSFGKYTGDLEGRRNGALISMASGKAVAEFRNVPDRDHVMNSISDGCARGTLKARSARVVYDDRKDTSGERKRDEATNLASRFGKKNASVYRRYDRVV